MKSSSQHSPASAHEHDDYYSLQKQKLQEKVQREVQAHRHEVVAQFNSLIPYFDESSDVERVVLIKLNNLLIHRFDGPGMLYWNIFRSEPSELLYYKDMLADSFTTDDEISELIALLEQKKAENAYEVSEDDDLGDEVSMQSYWDTDVDLLAA